jgi:streptogramin lyase
VASHDGNTLYRVDPATNKVVGRIRVGTEACGTPAIGLGRVWVSGCGPGPLVSVDPKTDRVDKHTNYSSSLEMTTAAGKIWAGDPLDPVTLHVRASAEDVAAGAGSIWFLETETGLVKRVDPTTATITRTYRAGDPSALETFGVFASGALWVYSPGSRLWRIDAATNHVTSQVLKGIAGAGATFDVGDGAVWVRPNDGNLYRFDQSTFKRKTYPADTSSGGFVTIAFGSVWESNIDDDSLWRVRE